MIEDEMVGLHHRLIDMSLSKLQDIVKYSVAYHTTVHGVTKSQTRLYNQTTPIKLKY